MDLNFSFEFCSVLMLHPTKFLDLAVAAAEKFLAVERSRRGFGGMSGSIFGFGFVCEIWGLLYFRTMYSD